MIFWLFFGTITITYPINNFCLKESIFQWQIRLISYEVGFDTSEGNHLSYFQNGYFFKIIWRSNEPHIQGICRWRNKTFSECFSIKSQRYTFVSFYGIWSLLQGNINIFEWNDNSLKTAKNLALKIDFQCQESLESFGK